MIDNKEMRYCIEGIKRQLYFADRDIQISIRENGVNISSQFLFLATIAGKVVYDKSSIRIGSNCMSYHELINNVRIENGFLHEFSHSLDVELGNENIFKDVFNTISILSNKTVIVNAMRSVSLIDLHIDKIDPISSQNYLTIAILEYLNSKISDLSNDNNDNILKVLDRVIDIKYNKSVINMNAGNGSMIMQLTNNRESSLTLVDENEENVIKGKLLSIICDKTINMVREHRYSYHTIDTYDYVISTVPTSFRPNKFDTDIRISDVMKSDLYCLYSALELLKSDGVAAICLPLGWLSSLSKRNLIVKEQLLNSNHIDTIIEFPHKFINQTNLTMCVVILKKNKRLNDIMMIRLTGGNAAEYFSKGKTSRMTMSTEGLSALSELVENRKAVEGLSCLVDVSYMKEYYDLSPSRYIQEKQNTSHMRSVDIIKKDLDNVINEIVQLNKN